MGHSPFPTWACLAWTSSRPSSTRPRSVVCLCCGHTDCDSFASPATFFVAHWLTALPVYLSPVPLSAVLHSRSRQRRGQARVRGGVRGPRERHPRGCDRDDRHPVLRQVRVSACVPPPPPPSRRTWLCCVFAWCALRHGDAAPSTPCCVQACGRRGHRSPVPGNTSQPFANTCPPHVIPPMSHSQQTQCTFSCSRFRSGFSWLLLLVHSKRFFKKCSERFIPDTQNTGYRRQTVSQHFQHALDQPEKDGRHTHQTGGGQSLSHIETQHLDSKGCAGVVKCLAQL